MLSFQNTKIPKPILQIKPAASLLWNTTSIQIPKARSELYTYSLRIPAFPVIPKQIKTTC